MSVIAKYDSGEFCWTNLGASDPEAAKKFYRELFGWSYREVPTNNGLYSICQVNGHDVCAIFPMMEDQRKMKIPPHWLPYIAVDNVEGAVSKAKAAGAKLLHNPEDAMDAGRFAVLQDPTGGAFAVWQARKHVGAGLGEESGTVCWRELTTPNLDIAAKFYSTVFGWTGSARDMGTGMTYHMFALGEDGVAGMMLPPKKEIPPHWLTYWLVENTDATLAQSKRLGAHVLVPSTAIPGMGRFAVISDPQGAVFGIFQGDGS